MQQDTTPSRLFRRQAGVLLHPSSLSGPHGVGGMGRPAREFVDWLVSSGFALWQILPLCPPNATLSPYSSPASLAGNPFLIDLDELVDVGLLTSDDLQSFAALPSEALTVDAAIPLKLAAVSRACHRLLASPEHPLHQRFLAYRRANAAWLEDTALFFALRRHLDNQPWWAWEHPLRDRHPTAVAAMCRDLCDEITIECAMQFLFDWQWAALCNYCKERGITLMGDVPIYVRSDSVDVWTHRDLFLLDDQGTPTVVAGCPPDYFAELGQVWGSPLYNWPRMAEDDYAWWRARFQRLLTQTDYVRIDHFRAFSAYWEIPFGAADARGGRWVNGPGQQFFDVMKRYFGEFPIVVEDLGLIDDAVIELRDAIGAPGMRILHYAFGGDPNNPHLPHNHTPNSLVYTGTHDNNTTVGWWHERPDHEKYFVREYLGVDFGDDVAGELVRSALASVADLAILPMQDILRLGGEARMNVPGGRNPPNWRWRMDANACSVDLARWLREQLSRYARI